MMKNANGELIRSGMTRRVAMMVGFIAIIGLVTAGRAEQRFEQEQELLTLKGHTNRVTSVAFQPGWKMVGVGEPRSDSESLEGQQRCLTTFSWS